MDELSDMCKSVLNEYPVMICNCFLNKNLAIFYFYFFNLGYNVNMCLIIQKLIFPWPFAMTFSLETQYCYKQLYRT